MVFQDNDFDRNPQRAFKLGHDRYSWFLQVTSDALALALALARRPCSRSMLTEVHSRTVAYNSACCSCSNTTWGSCVTTA